MKSNNSQLNPFLTDNFESNPNQDSQPFPDVTLMERQETQLWSQNDSSQTTQLDTLQCHEKDMEMEGNIFTLPSNQIKNQTVEPLWPNLDDSLEIPGISKPQEIIQMQETMLLKTETSLKKEITKLQKNKQQSITEFFEYAKSGKPFRNWVESNEGNNHVLNLDRYQKNYQIAKTLYRKVYPVRGVRLVWVYGAPHTGKTYLANKTIPDILGVKPQHKRTAKWWDGTIVDSSEYVILEDVDHAWFKYNGYPSTDICSNLKIWGDQHPFLAEYKGGMASISPRVVIVTSNYRFSELYKFGARLESEASLDNEVLFKAVERRMVELEITEVLNKSRPTNAWALQARNVRDEIVKLFNTNTYIEDVIEISDDDQINIDDDFSR